MRTIKKTTEQVVAQFGSDIALQSKGEYQNRLEEQIASDLDVIWNTDKNGNPVSLISAAEKGAQP